jgi:hypothetical protein
MGMLPAATPQHYYRLQQAAVRRPRMEGMKVE